VEKAGRCCQFCRASDTVEMKTAWHPIRL